MVDIQKSNQFNAIRQALADGEIILSCAPNCTQKEAGYQAMLALLERSHELLRKLSKSVDIATVTLTRDRFDEESGKNIIGEKVAIPDSALEFAQLLKGAEFAISIKIKNPDHRVYFRDTAVFTGGTLAKGRMGDIDAIADLINCLGSDPALITLLTDPENIPVVSKDVKPPNPRKSWAAAALPQAALPRETPDVVATQGVLLRKFITDYFTKHNPSALHKGHDGFNRAAAKALFDAATPTGRQGIALARLGDFLSDRASLLGHGCPLDIVANALQLSEADKERLRAAASVVMTKIKKPVERSGSHVDGVAGTSSDQQIGATAR